jgi:integrase
MRIGKLTALQVQRALRAGERGLINDGGGLYLKDGSSWICRYKRGTVSRDMGLGSAHTVSLTDARQKAAEARRLLADGKDPIAERRASRAAALKMVTFAEEAANYVGTHRAGWRSEKHAQQWEASLETYVYPVIGGMKEDEIGVAEVLRVLTPIWTEKPETANRVRNRIELILDAAKARGVRSGENPARWRGHLDKLLPPRAKVRKAEHFAALPYSEIGTFMMELRGQAGVASRCLEFAILCAARSGEALGAQWSEISLHEKLWTVPGSRTKSGREHRVPLPDTAIAILEQMEAIRQSDFIFPGRRGPLSGFALQSALKRMGREDVTVHGFRSTFRDWVGDATHFPREVSEQALGHVVGDRVEQAYRRSDALARRRKLMDAWASYCRQTSGERGRVVRFGTRSQPAS